MTLKQRGEIYETEYFQGFDRSIHHLCDVYGDGSRHVGILGGCCMALQRR